MDALKQLNALRTSAKRTLAKLDAKVRPTRTDLHHRFEALTDLHFVALNLLKPDPSLASELRRALKGVKRRHSEFDRFDIEGAAIIKELAPGQFKVAHDFASRAELAAGLERRRSRLGLMPPDAQSVFELDFQFQQGRSGATIVKLLTALAPSVVSKEGEAAARKLALDIDRWLAVEATEVPKAKQLRATLKPALSALKKLRRARSV